MKKIIMVNSPVSIYINKTAFIPLPLLVLSACFKKMRKTGFCFDWEVVDLDLMLKQGIFADAPTFYDQSSFLIMKKEPDILFFTVHGLNHVVVLNLAERIKHERPDCLIVVGGVGPTLMAGEALRRCKHVDIIVRGEGEVVIKSLISAAMDNQDFSSVPSIAYRKNGKVVENPRIFLDKDEPIPFPDYASVCLEDYFIHNKNYPYIHPGFTLIESGRGCRHHCLFCAPAKMWENQVRYRPIPEIIEEMKFLAEKGGDFSFFTQDNVDETFLNDLSRALIRENVGISWGCYSRLDLLPIDMAGLLSKSGCKLIFTGFETPQRNMQKVIRKVIEIENSFIKLQHFNASGISLICSFIAGFQGETEEDLDWTMRFAIECAAGMESGQIDSLISRTDPAKLPSKRRNICSIHPLCYMPGTDSFRKNIDTLYISKYSLHPDCCGSYLFSYNEFRDDWSFLGINPYLNHLPEEKVRFYYSVLRLFNLLNSQPYHFKLFLSKLNDSPLRVMKKMAVHLGEEFVLTSGIEEFEMQSRGYVSEYLPFLPPLTVKKVKNIGL